MKWSLVLLTIHLFGLPFGFPRCGSSVFARAPVPKEKVPSNDTCGTFKPRYVHIDRMPSFCFDDTIAIGTPSWRAASARWHDLTTGKTVELFGGHEEAINAVLISADRKLVVTGSGKRRIMAGPPLGGPPSDATIRLFDARTGKLLAKLEGHSERVVRVYLGPKNDRLLSVGEGDQAILWDVATKKPLATFPWAEYADDILLSPDGRHVAEWTKEKTLHLWDAETGKKRVSSMRIADISTYQMPTIDFHSRRVLAGVAGEQHGISLWNLDTGKKTAEFEKLTASVACVGFVPDKNWVVAGLRDGNVRVWDTDTKKEVAAFKHDGPVEVLHPSRNGQTLYIEWVEDNRMGRFRRGVLWDIKTGKQIAKEDEFVGFNPNGSKYLTVESVKGIAAGKPAVWYDSLTGKKIEK